MNYFLKQLYKEETGNSAPEEYDIYDDYGVKEVGFTSVYSDYLAWLEAEVEKLKKNRL